MSYLGHINNLKDNDKHNFFVDDLNSNELIMERYKDILNNKKKFKKILTTV